MTSAPIENDWTCPSNQIESGRRDNVRMAKAAWISTGAVFGFSLLALASIGVFLLPIVLALAAVLSAFRLSHAWLFVMAAGASFALGWLTLIVDPNAPDDSPWPLVCGLVVGAIGTFFYVRTERT